MTRVATLLLTFAATALPTTTWAQDPASAELLFEAGKRLWLEGEREEACAKFQASYELDPAASTLVKLARCDEWRGDLAAAFAAYTEARKLNEESPRAKHREALGRTIQEALATLAPRLAYVVLEVDAGGVPPVVFRDGKLLPAEAIGEKLVASPGKVCFRSEAEGHEPDERCVELAQGETRTVSQSLKRIEFLGADPQAPPVAPVAAVLDAPAQPGGFGGSSVPRGATQFEVAGIGVGCAGLAALSVGAALGVATLVKVNASASHCDPADFCDADGVRLRQQAGDLQLAAIATAASGAVLVGTGALLYWGPWDAEPSIAIGPRGMWLEGSF